MNDRRSKLMNVNLQYRLTIGFIICLGALLTQEVFAYPPAPHHLLYGQVRDELGNAIDIPSAEVILEPLSGLELKTGLSPDYLEAGTNYRLEVPMDSGITSSLYKPTALRPFLPFRLKVKIGRTTYLPIEMVGDYSKIGLPGATTRIDLTLGKRQRRRWDPRCLGRGLISFFKRNDKYH